MEIRQKYESDGKCFAKMYSGCKILGTPCGKDCGTYMCSFYKPMDCKDWVRHDSKNGLVRMFAPEEYGYGKDK